MNAEPYRIVTRKQNTLEIIGYAYGNTPKEAEKNITIDGLWSFSILKNGNYRPVDKDEFYR